jgi:hypothetical protein
MKTYLKLRESFDFAARKETSIEVLQKMISVERINVNQTQVNVKLIFLYFVPAFNTTEIIENKSMNDIQNIVIFETTGNDTSGSDIASMIMRKIHCLT